MRALMLTPDQGHLDRRIAQEAATLAGNGWAVDIYSAVDPTLRYEGWLAAGVRLLIGPGTPQPAGLRRRILRRMQRSVAGILPDAGRLIGMLAYRTHDIAGEIERASEAHLRSGGRYDLLVAHDAPVFPLAVSLKGVWDAPLICDLHEVIPDQDEHIASEAARAYWRRIEAGGLAAADGIIVADWAASDHIQRLHAPSAPCVVVHSSVPYIAPADLPGRTVRDVYPIPSGARIMLFTGSLHPPGHLEVLIEGFGQARLDGWVLAILGVGPLQPALEALVARLGLDDRVFLGRHTSQDDLIAVAASADIGLLPSREVGVNDRIATPDMLFEYIAARLPVATSRLPMIERIVDEHGTGGFLDFSTPVSTGLGLRTFVTERLPSIAPEALEAAARRFSWEIDEPALLELVETVMAGRGPGLEPIVRPDRPARLAGPPDPPGSPGAAPPPDPRRQPPRGWW